MQITPVIHGINIPFTVPAPSGPIPRSVNVFVCLGERITLIDSGVAGAEALIFAYLRQLGREPGEIERLVLTHSHPDHLGAARAIREASGCRVAAHAAERSWIEDTELQERERPVPGFRSLVAGPVAVDELLEEGGRLSVAPGITLEVLHTPGHSAGSISLRCPEEQLLFTGDAVLVTGDLPIFDDCRKALVSLAKLEEAGAQWLLSAWDEPRRGAAVGERLRESRAWLEKIHATVNAIGGSVRNPDPMELCRRAVAELGLPPLAANPLVARSFMSLVSGSP